jgi:GTPase
MRYIMNNKTEIPNEYEADEIDDELPKPDVGGLLDPDEEEGGEREEESGAEEKKPHISGFVAVVGLPNAGKSTLVNRFLREKISIVSPKPQTTRSNVTCILSSDDYQVIFVDTPGILKPRYRMQEVMASYITAATQDADLILLIIDASRYSGELPPPLVGFAEEMRGKKIVVALNKIDLIPKKEVLLELILKTNELIPGAEIIPISATEGEGTDELFDVILNHLPEGPIYFPEDMISNESERFFASELIREAIFLTMEEEIPYSTAVIIEGFEEKPANVVITASILVEKDSQKPILIGKKGATIKEIGTKARLAIEEFLGIKVFLDLHVKVRKDWRKKDVFLREIGLLKR